MKTLITFASTGTADYPLAVVVKDDRGVVVGGELLCRSMTHARVAASGVQHGLIAAGNASYSNFSSGGVEVDPRLQLEGGL